MKALQAVRHKLATACLKPVTVRKYDLHIGQYLRFMGPAPVVPIWSDESCALWVFHLMEVRGLAKNTLKGKLPAFIYGVHKHTGRVCETSKDRRYSVLGTLSRAIERRADDVKRKLAVGKHGLSQCYRTLVRRYCPEAALQLWTWWVVSYGALLRCSEAGRIQWEDVIFSSEYTEQYIPSAMTITIRTLEDETFKTQQCADSSDFRP